jgi:Flavodoxins
MSKVVIVYASAGGATEEAAYKMKGLIEGAAIYDIRRIGMSILAPFDFIIMGTPSAGYGDLVSYWRPILPEFDRFDFTGKKFALFGLGDAYQFGDSFAGGLGKLYKALEGRVEIVGSTSTEGYSYEASDAEIDGRFVGLVLDHANESLLTNGRIEKWIEELRQYF